MAKHQSEYHALRVGYREIDQIIAMSSVFFTESNYGGRMTFSPENLRKHLICAWSGGDFVTIMLIAADGRGAGYAHVQRDAMFTREPVGDLYQFYILPDHRATGGARVLRDAVVAQYRAWGCKMWYAESGAGLPGKNDMLFSNLWRKIGFESLGTVLFKRG